MLDKYIELLPEEHRAEYKQAIANTVVIGSREDAARLFNDNQYLRSERDAVISRATDNYAVKFKEEKLPGIVQDELKRLNPPKDVKDQAIAEMQAELAKMKKDALLKDRRAVAMQELTKIGLPVDLADFAIDEDENIFSSKIERLAGLNAWKEAELKKALTGAVGNQKAQTTGTETNSVEVQYNKALQSGDIAQAMALKAKLAESL